MGLIDSLIRSPWLWYGWLAVMAGSLARLPLRPGRRRESLLMFAECALLIGGPIAVSAVTNRIARHWIAYPLAAGGGLLLALLVLASRRGVHSRWVDVVALIYLIVFSALSLQLDWFDARGVITASVPLAFGFVVPIRHAPGSRPRVAPAVVALSAGVLASATLLYWMVTASHFYG